MSSPPQSLNYLGRPDPAELPPARRTPEFRVAVHCWLWPLVIGVAVYAASEVVRATAPPHVTFVPAHTSSPQSHPFFLLVNAGLIAIAGGTVLAAVGACAALVFTIRRWSAATDHWRQVFAPALGLLALLASNFAVAVLFAWIALR